MSFEYKEPTVCDHTDQKIKEYVSTGLNFIGQTVSCEIELFECTKCGQKTPKRKNCQ